MKTKSAAIAKSIEYRLTFAKPLNEFPVIALIEIEPCFMTGFEIYGIFNFSVRNNFIINLSQIN